MRDEPIRAGPASGEAARDESHRIGSVCGELMRDGPVGLGPVGGGCWAAWCRGRQGSGCRVGRGVCCGGGSAQVGRATWTSPSVMVMIQSPACRSTWWRRQSRHRLCTAVAPPSIQDCRWWASHCTGGAPHTTQPLSRAFRARRIAPVTSRSARPTSSGSDFDPSTSGMTFASQASRRIVAADRPSPYTTSPIASAAADFRSCRSMVTVMFAFAPNPGIRPDPPAPAAPSASAVPAPAVPPRPPYRPRPDRHQPHRVRRTGTSRTRRTGVSRTRRTGRARRDRHRPHSSDWQRPHLCGRRLLGCGRVRLGSWRVGWWRCRRRWRRG